ncbi:MAG: sel1 repeat family protein [Billgrantia sp.]
MEPIANRTRLIPSLRFTAAITLSAWLAGCAISQESPDGGHAGPVPAEYSSWFEVDIEAPMDGYDWDRINAAQDTIAQGRYDEAIEQLQPLMEMGFPPAFYEMGKLYERGQGVEVDRVEAARLYGKAIERPSPIHGHASLNLGRLYLEGRGVERNDVLAYYLLWQAKEADLDRNAEVLLARLLAEGGEGVEADPELAHRLYSEAAARGEPDALEALAEAHAPGGWLEQDPARSMDYAQRYADILENEAAQGDVNAMLQLASLHSEDGLLGDQPNQRIHWLQQAAEAGDLDALARAGRDLTRDGDRQQGLELLEDAASQGSVDAMTHLGQALLEPDTGRPEPVRAERWLREAIEAGSTDARVILGRALVEGQAGLNDLPRGMGLLEQAAEQDHPLALAQLGSLYLDDERVAGQPYIAVDYLERSHELGHPWATEQLGGALLEGRGTAPDPTRAEELLEQAAERGQSGAMRILGSAYLAGEVLPYDPVRGRELLEHAAQAGDTTALTQLGEAYLDGSLDGDPREGIRLVTQAAHEGDAYAMVVLGRAYRHGEGVERDLAEANRWLTRAQEAGHESADDALTYVQRDLGAQGDIQALVAAAEDGHPGAMADLGRAFLDGEGVERDQGRAEYWLGQAHQAGHAGAAASLGRLYMDRGDDATGVEYLEAAVARGHSGARANLGEAYLTGSHVEQDIDRGLELLQQAADAGMPNAAFALGEAYQHGEGVEQNAEEAERWYQQAIDGGADYATAALGLALMRGDGAIAQDVERGHELLLTAAEQGHPGAQASLGREYLRGVTVDRDPQRGADYLYEAASQGHHSARLALAEAYLTSRGLQANQEQALLWLDNVFESEGQLAVETLRQLLSDEEAIAAAGEVEVEE